MNSIDYFRSLEPSLADRFNNLSNDIKNNYDEWKDLFLEELYNRAIMHGQMRTVIIQEYTFSYVIVSSEEKYSETNSFVFSANETNAFVLFAEKRTITGICTDNANIIIKKSFDGNEEFFDIVALHERIEQLTNDHTNACYTELKEVFSRGEEFSLHFAEWFFHKGWDHPEVTCNRAIEGVCDELRKEKDLLKRLRMFYLKLGEHCS